MMEISPKSNFSDMSFRYMRLIVFFDLPVGLAKERKEYAKFRKALIKNGFIMMQESVYSKLLLNAQSAEFEKQFVRNNKPDSGLIQMLLVTENQYSRMELVLGDVKTEIVNTTERIVVI